MPVSAAKDGDTSRKMTYDEYLKKYSSRPDKQKRDLDDPNDVADDLAKDTVAAFREALSGLRQ